MKKAVFLVVVEWALRINVFLKLFNYGLGKIIGGQFYTPNNIPEQIASVSLGETGSYNLAWTFFGHSKGYILFIGISQLIGATLFLINKTKLLGGAILVPILLNIIVVDYFFGVAYGAIFSACFYLLSILWVFYRYRESVIVALKKLIVPKPVSMKRKKKMILLAVTVVTLALVFYVEYIGISLFGYEDR